MNMNTKLRFHWAYLFEIYKWIMVFETIGNDGYEAKRS